MESTKRNAQNRETKDCKVQKICCEVCLYRGFIYVKEWQHMTAVMLQSLAATAMKVGLGCGIVRLETSRRKWMKADTAVMAGKWKK